MSRIISGPARSMTLVRAGAILVLTAILLTYFTFTRSNPFSHQFILKAVFVDANYVIKNQPVRIAGVDVGKVKKVEALSKDKLLRPRQGQAMITMKIKDEGLPIHRDAELKVRPRIFLEGNYFIQVQPGSPTAGRLKSGDTIPVNQTASPVQFGDIFNILQSNTRDDLRTLLFEYSVNGLGGGGGQAFNKSIPYWEPAYRKSALANEATLGTQPGDVQRVIKGQQRTLDALSSEPDTLKSFIGNFNTTALAFARENVALAATIPALRDVTRAGPPALRSVDSSLPALSAFSKDALPGVKSSGPTIDASIPLIHQSRLLFSKPELRGLTADLRPTIPALARLNRDMIPFLDQTRAMSACTTNVLVPFGRETVPNPDPNEVSEPVDRLTGKAVVGLAGESRVTDANSPLFHIGLLAGNNTVFEPGQGSTGPGFFGSTSSKVKGARPAPEVRPSFRPGTPCELQDPPNLHAPYAGPPKQNGTIANTPFPPGKGTDALTKEFQMLADSLKPAGGVSPLAKQAKDKNGKPITLPFNDPLVADGHQLEQMLKLVEERDAKTAAKPGAPAGQPGAPAPNGAPAGGGPKP